MNAFAELDLLLQSATRTVAPAIVCRVEQHGDALFEAAFGALDPSHEGLSPPLDALFDLASVTKLFTVTACLRLCSTGALSLGTAIVDAVPTFAGVRAIGPTEDPITKLPVPASTFWQAVAPAVDAGTVDVRHLLTHTSGLPAWRNLFNVCGDTPRAGYVLTKAEIERRQQRGLAAIYDFDFVYPPGLSYSDSDIGLILLGEVVSTAYGASLDKALQELVISPLGLDIRFNPPPSEVERTAPTEYCRWRRRRLRAEVHDENASGLGGIAGHAGLFGTAASLCRLGRLYLESGQGLVAENLVRRSVACEIAADSPGEPLPDPQRSCAAPNPEVRRGLGWMLQTPRGASCGPEWSERGFGHTGYTGTSLWCDPDLGLAVALLTNRVYWGRDPAPIERLRKQVHTSIVRTVRQG